MDYVKQWIMSVAVCAVIGGIVMILTPNGSIQTAVRTAVSLTILCVMLSPFIKGFNIQMPSISSTQTVTDIKTNTADVFKETIREKISSILENYGIKNYEISINITINDDNEIEIENVTVFTDKSIDTSSAEKEINSQLGIVATFEVK